MHSCLWRGRRIRSGILVFAAVLSIPICAYEPYEDEGPRGNRNDASVVVVRTFDTGGKPSAQCNGFFIGEEGALVTSRHILDKAAKVEIVTIEGKVFKVSEVLAEDREADLIILRSEIPQEIVRPLSIKDDLPLPNAKIMVRVSALLFSDGQVDKIRLIPGFGHVFEISAPISAVASGSPVVNMDGDVLGVATHVSAGGDPIQVAIPAGRLSKMDRRNGVTFASWQSNRPEYKEGPAEKFYRQALMLLWGGNHDDAAEYLQQAVNKSKNHERSYELLSFCYEELERPQEQSKAIQQLIRIDPNNIGRYLSLAEVYRTHGYPKEVVRILGHAMKVDPNSFRVLTMIGDAHRELGDPELAVKTIKRALSVKADYDTAYVKLGDAYLEMKKEEWALSAYTQATNVNPRNIEAHLKLADLHRGLDNQAQAVAVLEAARAADSQNVQVMIELATAYLQQNRDLAKAVQLLERANTEMPMNSQVLYQLGIAALAMNDTASAREKLELLEKMQSPHTGSLGARLQEKEPRRPVDSNNSRN